MAEPAQAPRSQGARVAAWVTAALGISAAISIAYGLFLALGRDDTEALESPLLLALARQLVAGPWHLYGPFGRQNTLVMIHSPLYYHLAALLVWPLFRAGLDPVPAAAVGGRALSIICMGLTLGALYRLARLDGAGARAGWWSAFLFAAIPIVGVQPYAVRPDLLGVSLQTIGILWMLQALKAGGSRGGRIVAAYVLFGLAFCVKLNFIVGPIVGTGLLAVALQNGRISGSLIARALFALVTVVVVLYGAEELATDGQMSRAILQAGFQASRVHPASWNHAAIVLVAIVGRSTGLVALLTASGVAAARARPGLGRRLAALAGSVLIGVLLLSGIRQFGQISSPEEVIAFLCLCACLALAIPIFGLLEPAAFAHGRLDTALWAFCAGELAVVVALARTSTGAWVNYALEAAALVSVICARALARRCDEGLRPGASASIVLAALVVLAGTSFSTYEDLLRRRNDRLAMEQIVQAVGRPATEFFFVGRPGWNRVHGHVELVYDDWLYPVFESIHLAEPRSSWLRLALASREIRFVVTPSDSPEIEGLGRTLNQLGFVQSIQLGPHFVWERILRARTDQ
jgi:hypothetical protein